MATADGQVRVQYERSTSALAAELEGEVRAGRLTWRQGADQAWRARNDAMELMRTRSTPIGRSLAEQLKPQGKTLNELVARKTMELHPNKAFDALSKAEQDEVFAAIVAAAGRANPRVSAMMRGASRCGRALLVLSLALSIYNIATADDHWAAARREVVVTGTGIAGAMAGGALAGLACGPGAPVCATVGAFACGALAALGVDFAFFHKR
jgi:hypothetical protein